MFGGWDLAGGSVDDSDVEVLDEDADVGSGVGPADADMMESAVVRQGHVAGLADVVGVDAVVGVGAAVGAGAGLGRAVAVLGCRDGESVDHDRGADPAMHREVQGVAEVVVEPGDDLHILALGGVGLRSSDARFCDELVGQSGGAVESIPATVVIDDRRRLGVVGQRLALISSVTRATHRVEPPARTRSTTEARTIVGAAGK